ncbi:hypothetical protein J3F83DRAFT_76129 [Trichoderma novae-zelandiae]
MLVARKQKMPHIQLSAIGKQGHPALRGNSRGWPSRRSTRYLIYLVLVIQVESSVSSSSSSPSFFASISEKRIRMESLKLARRFHLMRVQKNDAPFILTGAKLAATRRQGNEWLVMIGTMCSAGEQLRKHQTPDARLIFRLRLREMSPAPVSIQMARAGGCKTQLCIQRHLPYTEFKPSQVGSVSAICAGSVRGPCLTSIKPVNTHSFQRLGSTTRHCTSAQGIMMSVMGKIHCSCYMSMSQRHART